MDISAKKPSFAQRLGSMLRVDLRRLRKSKRLYIVLACAFLMPVLMTVMMTMMDGSVSVDRVTGEETILSGPENVWQNLGTLPGGENMGGSEVFAMCNINMVFMAVAVIVCLFISDDFRSGYAKNIFAVRAKKGEYVLSKQLCGFFCGAAMLAAYFVGTLLGGALSGLSFELCGLTAGNLVMSLLAKALLMNVFVAVDVAVSVAAKQRAWLCLCGSLGAGMLLFMMASVAAPLNATIGNVLLCAVGGALFALALGILSKKILEKTSLV